MNPEPAIFSEAFQRLYCNPALYDPFSALHPISLRGVLPFRSTDRMMDQAPLLTAEQAHLAHANDTTRRAVIEFYRQCGLLADADASNVISMIDYFDAEFFGLMGMVYANAGMFICALRWYRELIAELESQRPNLSSDNEEVYASVGYCLYSLGLFAEAISWSKSCIGPVQSADMICRALIQAETQEFSGVIRAVQRVGPRTRYIIAFSDRAQADQAAPRIKLAMKMFAPFREIYLDWATPGNDGPGLEPDGYPFGPEFGTHTLLQHKMNLLFATCGQADALLERGYALEARRLLWEAAMIEPRADFIQSRIRIQNP